MKQSCRILVSSSIHYQIGRQTQDRWRVRDAMASQGIESTSRRLTEKGTQHSHQQKGSPIDCRSWTRCEAVEIACVLHISSLSSRQKSRLANTIRYITTNSNKTAKRIYSRWEFPTTRLFVPRARLTGRTDNTLYIREDSEAQSILD